MSRVEAAEASGSGAAGAGSSGNSNGKGSAKADNVAGIPVTGEKLAFDSTDKSSAVLFDILNLEEIDTHLFRGYSPKVPRWGRIYGGQTVGQALVAAGRTTDSHFVVHSLHAMFIRPGNDDIPVLYQVDHTRDGQTFCTRRVRAIQKGKDIFIASVSFKLIEKPPQYAHAEPMPPVPDPDTLPSIWEPYRKRHEKSGVDQFPFPVDIKRISPLPDAKGWMPRDQGAATRSWVRVNGKLPDNPLMHFCAMAYLSDWGLMSTSLIPHGYNIRGNKHVQMASIDHSVWFHTPFRADDWLLHDTYSPRASNGTSLNFGKFYTRSGVHCVSTAQEGLIRLIANAPPEMPLATATASASSTSHTTERKAKGSKSAAVEKAKPAAPPASGSGSGNLKFATPSRYFDTIAPSASHSSNAAAADSSSAPAPAASATVSAATAASTAPDASRSGAQNSVVSGVQSLPSRL